MLTRSQVAQRLGKSIATVRRLEGSSLHPSRDRDGVHRFDAREVEWLVNGRRETALTPWQRARPTEEQQGNARWESDRQQRETSLDEARRDERTLRAQLETAEGRIAELTQREAQVIKESQGLQQALWKGLADWLESRSERQLKQLALGGVDELLELILELQTASHPRKLNTRGPEARWK
jgi:hypothetical protein